MTAPEKEGREGRRETIMFICLLVVFALSVALMVRLDADWLVVVVAGSALWLGILIGDVTNA